MGRGRGGSLLGRRFGGRRCWSCEDLGGWEGWGGLMAFEIRVGVFWKSRIRDGIPECIVGKWRTGDSKLALQIDNRIREELLPNWIY